MNMYVCLCAVGDYSDCHVDSQSVDHRKAVADTDAMLDYIERFNELIENKQYNMAAVHAANSPHGILRTTETLHRLAGSLTTLNTAWLLRNCLKKVSDPPDTM